MKRIIFTVTNDLSYDQRMARICTSLSEAGYDVLLVGRKTRGALPLTGRPYRQKRLSSVFGRGKLMYAVFNVRLLCYLLFQRAHAICAIDLDTILPCLFVSRLKNIPRVYDAHELFCEMKEIVSRPAVYKTWKKVEQYAVPKFSNGYTVNSIIAGEFQKMYGVAYEVIANMTVLTPLTITEKKEKYILYQGAVNEGRSFETLIPAMQHVDALLVICGDGNFMIQARKLVTDYHVQHKVIFKGSVLPADLKLITQQAYIGVTLFDDTGISNYYSLANRFFDYIHAGIPQVCVAYPAYEQINNLHEVAVLVKDIGPENLAKWLNELLVNEVLYKKLADHCMQARQILNWQQEEKKLFAFYHKLLS
jgi:glycosyltransferase involved in cell wall biosynthesis